MAVDLLVFGPHPDDLEIGLGGTIARHAALGLTRRSVRSDRRRDGQQRHRRGAAGGRRGGARGARRGLAREPALARPAHRQGPGASGAGGRVHPAAPAAGDRRAVLVRSSSRSRGRQRGADRGGRSTAGLRRYPADGEAWKAEWICYYFINDSAPPSFVVDVSDHYEQKRAALDCHAQPVPARDPAPRPRV